MKSAAGGRGLLSQDKSRCRGLPLRREFLKRAAFPAVGALLLAGASLHAQQDNPRLVAAPGTDRLSAEILKMKRIYVDRLTGGETAAQMRDLIITSLQNSKLFILTENQDRADAILRGAAEDLIYTDLFDSSDSVDIRGGASAGTRSTRTSSSAGATSGHSLSLGAGEHESTDTKERKHEALATVRLVDKDGDVVWSTTQESNGAKFRGASADVADKITRQLMTDYERARKAAALK
jgi:hypothetical protein